MKKLIFSLIAILISLSSFSQDNERNNFLKLKLSIFTTELGYERILINNTKPLSLDIGFGIINSQFLNLKKNPQLYNLRLGIKQYQIKNPQNRGRMFLKHEFFSQYAYKIYNTNTRNSMDYYTFAYTFSIGHQFLFFKRISLEMNMGLGLAYSNFTYGDESCFNIDFGLVDLDGVRFGIWKKDDWKLSQCFVGAIKIGYHF